MSKFENIHPSKLAAFIDGCATTVCCLWLLGVIKKARKND